MFTLVLGLSKVAGGEITFGLLLSYLIYTERFYSPLLIMSQLITSMQTSMAALSRIQNLLSIKSKLSWPAKGVLFGDVEKATKKILEIENMSFRYDENTSVLQDVSLTLVKGKKYAFVGPTGGGKSTLAYLCARLFDPSSGKVKLKGVDIRKYNKEQITDTIGFILQEPFLFYGSIAQNIKYGNNAIKDLDDNDLLELLKKEGLDEIIKRFPQGLSTEVSKSSENISLGQKQLIAFVRAVLRKPQLLILDEATANIDTLTEDMLEVIIRNLPKETTLITIAHRLNTIEDADVIFFIGGKKVIQAGNLEQAIKYLDSKN